MVNKLLKPSILFVGNFLSSSGRNRSIAEELACCMNEAGYSVWTTSSFSFRPLRLLDMLITTYRVRKKYQIAYLEVYSGTAFLWAEMIAWLLGILRKPFVIALHGGDLPAFASIQSERVKRLLRTAVIVTAPSPYLQEKLQPYRNDIILLPNALDIKKYSFRLRSKVETRGVWLRAFHSLYNPQLTPLVVAGLSGLFPEIFFTMIGPDKGDGALQETQALIDKFGLQKNVEIVPGIPKSEVPYYLTQADVFINTTNVDNTPISIMEAMACGLCIVSTNVGGIPYLLENEKDALLVPPNDSAAMVGAINRILTEPDVAMRISQGARSKAERFDWQSVLLQWESLFASMVPESE